MLDAIITGVIVTVIAGVIFGAFRLVFPALRLLKGCWVRWQSRKAFGCNLLPPDSLGDDTNPFRDYVKDLLFGKVQTKWNWMETVLGYEPTDLKYSCPECGAVLNCIPKKDLSDSPIRRPSSCVKPPPNEFTKLHCEKCDNIVHKYYGTEAEMQQDFKKEILKNFVPADSDTISVDHLAE